MKGLGKTSSLGTALRVALERRGMDRSIREQQMLQRWSEIVGDAVARQATPRRLHDGVLWLSVPEATWRMELHSMRKELLKKINAAVGEELVREIRVQ
jgi:predicted nucleic acid-binding Zn ribbon protein